MQEVKSYYDAIKLLELNKVLAYKNVSGKLTFLTLVQDSRIAVFNDNLRYNISFDDLNELMKENKVFIFEQDIGTAN
jgi:hypothetical protein